MTNGTDRLDRIESILANLAERQDRFQTQMEESDRNLRESISDVVSLIGNLAEQDDQRAEEFRQRHEEHDQRFNNLLADSRADRQTNEREHQAFRESFQSLLAEIRAIWQRLAG
jgi:maltose O-acetyltransferase